MRYPSKRMTEISNYKVDRYMSDKNKEKNFRERQKRMAGDSNNRIELHTYIRESLLNGKSKEDILEYLLSVEKFEGLKDNFESYIDDHIKKIEKEKQGKAPTRAGWDK